MAVVATYPNGIVPWVNRVDLVNTVFAIDPNTLAAEVVAVERTLGLNPQIESAPPVGNPIMYATMGARVHDVQLGNQLPVCTVVHSSFTVPTSGEYGTNNSYPVAIYDPFKMTNGTGMTVKATGWYVVTAHQIVDRFPSGYAHIVLNVGSGEVSDDFWNWDFPANTESGGQWRGRGHVMQCVWQGGIQAGQRIWVSTENGVGTPMGCRNAYLRASFLRSLPPGQQA
jgi:hypothetical protein